jgi:hypothetical protein
MSGIPDMVPFGPGSRIQAELPVSYKSSSAHRPFLMIGKPPDRLIRLS